MRFEKDFSYTINHEGVPLECKIPSMLIQPLVENSIKHGLLNNLFDIPVHFFANEQDHQSRENQKY